MSPPPPDRTGPPLQRPALLLVFLVALLALPAIPTRELMPTDEPRFALVARQMIHDPAPIVPHLGYDPLTRQGEVYGDKPPVFFWCISLFSFLTGGVGEISARLPSFFAAIAAVLLTYRLSALLLDEETGFVAGAILATTNQFFLRAGWCSIDMLLTALTLGATYCWIRAARARELDRRAHLETPSSTERARSAEGTLSTKGHGPARTVLAACGGLLAAAATLSKGPVGIIYPLVFLAGYLLAPFLRARHWGQSDAGVARIPPAPRDRAVRTSPAPSDGEPFRLQRAIRALLSPPFLAAAGSYLAPLGIWFVAISVVGGSDYVREILFRQNVTRYVAAWNNQEPWYYYLYRLPIGLIPWTLLLPAAILSPRGAPEERARPLRGLLLSSAIVFLFFSASTGKRGVYLLPLYPALAILTAAAWTRVGAKPFRAMAAAHVSILAALGALGLVALPLLAHRRAPQLVPAAIILGALLAGVTTVSALFFFRGRAGASLGVMTAGLAVAVCGASLLLVPEANRRSGLREFGGQLAAVVRQDDYLVVDQEGYEQILFYSRLKGARRSFERTAFSTAADGSLVLSPKGSSSSKGDGTTAEPATDRSLAAARRPTEAERAMKAVRFPPGARVVFVLKGGDAQTLRAALGPSCRTLLASKLSGQPVVVIASR